MKTVTYEHRDGLAFVRLDDGKANALNLVFLAAIHEALNEAEKTNTPVVIYGRPGVFSAGFDLKELGAGEETACRLLRAGAELCLRLLAFPRPVIAACTGHAYPMGAFMLMSSDYRLGAEGAFKIGMNEATIGLVVPSFAIELARSRLTPAAFNRTVLTGAMFSPTEAAVAGLLDEVCAPNELMAAAARKGGELAALPAGAHAQTKRRLRAPLMDKIRHAIDSELNVEALRAVRSAAAG